MAASRWAMMPGLCVAISLGDMTASLKRLAREAGVEKLSMGMSGDYETAVAFGATSVRVGSAIFGSR